jgi:hypothetical protein
MMDKSNIASVLDRKSKEEINKALFKNSAR